MGLVRSISKRINKLKTRIQDYRDSRQGQVLHKDFEQFKKTYQELTDHRFDKQNRQPNPFDGAAEEQIQAATERLRRDGIAICRGWLDQQAVERARSEMAIWESQWREMFEGQQERARIEAPDRDAIFVYGNYPQDQRLRINFLPGDAPGKPTTVVNLLTDAKLTEIASRYFGTSSACDYVLAERLDPAPQGDRWHVDRIVDQVKAMVILTDVEMEQGPLRYKKTTHRNPSAMNEIYHRVFRNGVDEAYPDEGLVESLPGEIVYGCGRAGDCIIFDTLGVHSGTRCLEKYRQAFVATFAGPTNKTDRLLRLSQQNHI